jgi:hypothetical protein
MPKIVTANRLRNGEVVYLTPSGGWSTQIADGHAVDGAEQEDRLLASAARAEAELLIVVPYSMDVARVDGGLVPVSQRERIRAEGPTVRTEPRRPAAAIGQG